MINSIKKYFSKDNKENKESIIAVSRDDWEDSYKKLLDNIGDTTQTEFLKRINEKTLSLQDLSSDLLNETIAKETDARMQKILEEDRQLYINILLNFSEKSLIKMDKKLLYFNDLFKHFMNELKNFTQNIEKVYPQLKEAYPENIQKITNTIKDIHVDYKELEGLLKKGVLKDFEKLKEETKTYYSKIDEESLIRQTCDIARLDVLDNEKKLKIAENKKESIKLLREYKDIKEGYEEKERIEDKIRKNKEELSELIYSLHDLLEDYKKRPDANKSLVQKYLDDPSSALIYDTGFEINKVLGDLKFEANTKDNHAKKRQQKIAIAVDKILKKSYLSGWLNIFGGLQKSKKIVEDKIKNNKIMMDLQELDYQIDHLKSRISKKNAVVNSCNEKINELEIDSLREEIESKLKKVFGKRITVL